MTANDSDPLDYLSHYEGTVTTQKYNYASDRRYNIEEYVTDNTAMFIRAINRWIEYCQPR